ncbi:MAG: aminotransferase class III-fold pyridoxal phosphate-dependent enzyme [Aestuariivirga sp.]|uniref:aspartate aminotransferase family protein n=1 Tax=Aestuariivirga sp. TaxID=2650926 RepID=UPI0025C45A2D|nr:aminotransferase class III-fold pyridoxal phosphate-dependent enzyme [Aestuariivirga sp.]MCA3560591.1 aminotransferase class III-fold pyridoxal phosphate-dependent enzyme [Aestuariivirga sp.]
MADVEATLDHAKAQFAAKRPKTRALHERAAHVMPGGNTRTVLFTAPFPLRVETASGSTITDIDGHSYLDLLGEYSAGIYGHSHPRILEAARAALDKGLNYGAHHEGEVKLAEVVTKRFNMDLVRFTNSGTEANMMALSAARCFTGRSKIMPMDGGYHGGTLYFSHGASPVNAPFDCVMGEYNDVEITRERIIENADDLAAVILEPMLGGGGGISASHDFLAMLREETQKRGIVLIFDEVMTSRLHPGGLSAKLGIEPDLKTLGKYVGGGMSFGAFGGRADIMALFDPASPTALPHAGTFNNNTLTMNVGHVAMTEIYTPAACDELNARGDRLREALNDLFMRYQVKMKAMGQGSMIVIHPTASTINSPHDIEHTDKRLRQLLFLDLLDQGIYMAERGFMALSLMVTDADCGRVVGAVEDYVNRRRELLV